MAENKTRSVRSPAPPVARNRSSTVEPSRRNAFSRMQRGDGQREEVTSPTPIETDRFAQGSAFGQSSRLVRELAASIQNTSRTHGNLEDRFLTLLREYKQQCRGLKPEAMQNGTTTSSSSAPSGGWEDHLHNPLENVPFPEVPQDVEETADNFRAWRRSFVTNEVNPGRLLPKLRLKADRIQRDVDCAITKTGGADSLHGYMRLSTLQRLGTLRCLRNMLTGRLRCFNNSSNNQQQVGRYSNDVVSTFSASLKLIDKETDAVQQRMQKLTGRETPDTNESAWITSCIPLLRQQLSEDVASKPVRLFLRKLQYCVVSHRARLWRRSLELHAISEMRSQTGESEPQSAPLPLGVLSRRATERVAQELGALYQCNVSMQTDKGKTFYHQVAVIFPTAFHEQETRMKFQAYVVGEERAPHNIPMPGTTSDVSDTAGVVAGGTGGASASPGSGDDTELCHLRPSGWARHMPWRAQIEPSVVEQGVLLRASHAAGKTPTRIEHGTPSYARVMVDNVVSTSKSKCDEAAAIEWEADLDSVLCAERCFLQVSEMKKVAHRLNDLAEQAGPDENSSSTVAASTGADKQGSLPPPMLKAFYMLRHLDCRAKRHQLLSYLNFCRFLQRRLVVGLGEGAPRVTQPNSGARPSRAAGGDRLRSTDANNAPWTTDRAAPVASGVGSGMDDEQLLGHDKYWDYSPRTLQRLCQQFTTSVLERESNDTTGVVADLPPYSHGEFPFDREIIHKLDDDEFHVTDESGRRIMHAGALDDLESLEREMLSIGSYYIHKFEATSKDGAERTRVNRPGVLYDLYASEVWFCNEKRKLLEVYLEIYEHTADPLEKWDLSQRIVDIMAIRPRLDLEAEYFTDAYAVSICLFQARASLVKQMLKYQVLAERSVMAWASERVRGFQHSVPSEAHLGRQEASEQAHPDRLKRKTVDRYGSTDRFATQALNSSYGDADGDGASSESSDRDEEFLSCAHPLEGYSVSSFGSKATHMQITPSAEPIAVDEFFVCSCMVWKAELILEDVLRDLTECFHPTSPIMTTFLERSCYAFALGEWKSVLDEDRKAKSGPSWTQKQIVTPEYDPELLFEVVKEAATQIATGGTVARDKHHDERLKNMSHSPLAKSSFGALDVDPHLHMAFADVRRKGGTNVTEIYAHLLQNLLEHVLLRRSLMDIATEVKFLETTVYWQGVTFNHKMDTKRPHPIYETTHKTGLELSSGHDRSSADNTWIEPTGGPKLTAGFLFGDMGLMNLTTSYQMCLHLCASRIQELRIVYQHEIAWRYLVCTCVQYNAVLLDPQVRQKEASDVALVGPVREVFGDLGPIVARKLAATTSLSGAYKETRKKRGPPRVGELQTFMDMSRYTQHVQNPFVIILPVLAAVKKVFEGKDEYLFLLPKGSQMEVDRQMRDLWCRLVPCSTFCLTKMSCDLALRIQATRTSYGLRTLSAMLPSRFSPFATMADRKQPLVEKDGTVGSIFSIPHSLDTLLMRGIKADADLAATVESTFALSEPNAGKSEPMSKERSEARRVASRQSAQRASVGLTQEVAGVFTAPKSLQLVHIPQLEIEYDGTAIVALRILHELITLFALRYTICTIDADAVTILRMQRKVRYGFADIERTSAVENLLSRTDPTYEALENMRDDLSSLVRRVDALNSESSGGGIGGVPTSGAAAGGAPAPRNDPERILSILKSEISAAHSMLLTLFRLATHECLREGAVDDAAEFRRWIEYVESGRSSMGFLSAPKPPCGYRAPVLASLPIFAVRDKVGSNTNITTEEGEPAMEESKNWGCGDSDVESIAALFFWPRSTAGQSHARTKIVETACRADTAMKWDLLTKDRHRYVALFHPSLTMEHPRLQAPMPTLLAGYVTCVPNQQYAAIQGGSDPVASPSDLQPWPGLVALSGPPPPLVRLVSSICSIPISRRRLLSALRLELLDKRALYRSRNFGPQHRNSAASSSKQTELEASDSDVDFFGAHLLLHVLKERVICGQLVARPPATAGELARFEAHSAIYFPHPEDEMRRWQVGNYSGKKKEERIHAVEALMEANYQGIAELVVALDQLLLAVACDRLRRELAGVMGVRHRDIAARSARLSTKRRTRMEKRGGDITASTVDIVLRSSNWLRACSTFVRLDQDDENGERAYVFGEDHLNTCVEDLLQRVPNWGNDILQSRESLCEQIVQYQTARLSSLQQEQELQERSASSYQAWETQVKREVANRGSQLVFEVERIHRDVQELQTVSNELEYRLNSEVWEKVRSAVQGVTQELAAASADFKQGQGLRAQEVAAQMRSIRERVASDFAALAARNLAMQTGASQDLPARDVDGARVSSFPEEPSEVSSGMKVKTMEIARRDDVRFLRLQVQELKNKVVCARAFHHFKCQAMRHKFIDQMRALQMTLSSNQELLTRLATASHHHTLLAAEFNSTAQTMALAELDITEKVATAEASLENRQRLQSWRRHKARQLEHIAQKVRDHERVGTVDVEGMVHDIQEKTKLVEKLKAERQEEEEALAETVEQCSMKTEKLRDDLRVRQRAKEASRQELQRQRVQAEVTHLTEQERLEIWHARVDNARRRRAELEEEQRQLRQIHAVLGED